MFIEVTAKNTGNKYIFPKIHTYVYTGDYTPNTSETIVGTLGGNLKVSVKESYEEIKRLLGVTNGN